MNPRCGWFTRVSRRVLFNATERSRFLTVLRVQVEAGLPESHIFANLAETGYSDRVRDLAAVSQLGSLEAGQFTAYWHTHGFFPQKDVHMINAALTSGSLVDAIDILLTSDDKQTRFASAVVGKSASYLVFAAGFVVMLVAMGGERATLERVFDDLLLFAMLDWLDRWHMPLMIVTGLLWALYGWGRASWDGPLRRAAKQCWVFKTHDRQFAAEACRLSGRLSGRGVTIDTILDVLASVYRAPYQQLTLESCRGRIGAGFPVHEALSDLLEPRYRHFLASMAPAASEAQLARGFPAVAALIDVDIAEAFDHMYVYVVTASLIVSLGILMALMEIMTGANMSLS